jgi:hypothetical protein
MKWEKIRVSGLHRVITNGKALFCRILLLLPLMLPVATQAQFTYVTNNGAITITRYNGSGGAVTIPDTINGLPVTSIGYVFSHCTSLTDVTIGTNITSLRDQAFGYCYSLTNVTIPDSVTNIADNAFLQCYSLISVTIPKRVTSIGARAFECCFNLTAITVNTNNPVYSSLAGVLFNKSKNTLIQCPGRMTGAYTIPNSVTSIGDYAFSECIYLTSVTIPDSVTSIGEWAFFNCHNLTNMTIPNSVTNIADDVFGYCFSLTAITVDTNNPVYSSLAGVLFNQGQTTLIKYPAGITGSYTVPNTVTSIGDMAFYACISLTGVTISSNATNIGDRAFLGCTSLTNATIGNSVTSIGNFAFMDCPLTSITIPYSVTSIGGYTFAWCSLTNATIGNSVIGNNEFYYCTSLTSVTIGNSVTNIADDAFAYCTNLTGVYFQGNAPSVGLSVFDGDNNATVYYLPGTTNWSSTFSGRPAVLWNPQAQTSDASFGVRTNCFGFNVTGTINIPIVLEASTSLTSPVWTTMQSCALTNGSIYFGDPGWTNYPTRYYRIRSP